MTGETLKKLLHDAVSNTCNLVVTAYKKADTECRIKEQEVQNQIARNRETLLAFEYFQHMTLYPMPAQYGLDIESNLVLCKWVADNRYTLRIPTVKKEKLQPHDLKLRFKEHLVHNLDLHKAAIYDQLSLGYQPTYQLIQYMQILNVYQSEAGYIKIDVVLRNN